MSKSEDVVGSASSVAERKAGRTFPSVFQAWNPADSLPGEDRWVTLARHDLMWGSPPQLDLRWDAPAAGLGERFTPESVAAGRRRRAALADLNPSLILLAEVRYRDAAAGFLPEGHPWWKRDDTGDLVAGWAEGGFFQLDFANPACRAHVAAQARAVVQSGVFDGVMLDWWQDDEDRLALVQAVREAIGPRAVILANTNDRTCPRTAAQINGLFMECTVTDRPDKWRRIAETLTWAEGRLREPRLNCLETWYHTSRDDLHLLRATTTLALTHSDGYCLFSDPNPLPTPDHLHDWYAFWDAPLGRPLAAGAPRAAPEVCPQWDPEHPLPADKNRTAVREFEGGTAVYNPPDGEAVVIRFGEPRTSAATRRRAATHYLGNLDGDLYVVR